MTIDYCKHTITNNYQYVINLSCECYLWPCVARSPKKWQNSLVNYYKKVYSKELKGESAPEWEEEEEDREGDEEDEEEEAEV